MNEEIKIRLTKAQKERLEEKMKNMTKEQREAFLEFWERMSWDYD